MRKRIAKVSGFLCVIGGILMIISDYVSDEYDYIVWGIGVVVLGLNAILYLCTGKKPSELFMKFLDFL